jgi:hypothetical protein
MEERANMPNMRSADEVFALFMVSYVLHLQFTIH